MKIVICTVASILLVIGLGGCGRIESNLERAAAAKQACDLLGGKGELRKQRSTFTVEYDVFVCVVNHQVLVTPI